MTILGSVPTGLLWYGYYKFSVEEELFHHEIETAGKPKSAGGFGTLLPFTWCFILGNALSLGPLHLIDAGNFVTGLGGAWVLAGQVNLYLRVNDMCEERFGTRPLWAWWALLPPPIDVVVGLRQVHFLAKYWADVRGEEWTKDVIAEELFPFISEEKRFTLTEFISEPRRWFWFTKNWENFW